MAGNANKPGLQSRRTRTRSGCYVSRSLSDVHTIGKSYNCNPKNPL